MTFVERVGLSTIQEYLNKYSAREVALRLGISLSRLNVVVRQYGLKTLGHRSTTGHISKEQLEDCLRSCPKRLAAEKLGVSFLSLKRLARRCGVRLDSARKLPREPFIREWNSGTSVKVLMCRFGVSKTAIVGAVTRYGLKKRGPGGSQALKLKVNLAWNKAWEDCYVENVGWVRRTAAYMLRRVEYGPLTLDGAVSVGVTALWKSWRKYSRPKRVKFVTYATWCVRGDIAHYVRDTVRQERKYKEVQRAYAEVLGAAEAKVCGYRSRFVVRM